MKHFWIFSDFCLKFHVKHLHLLCLMLGFFVDVAVFGGLLVWVWIKLLLGQAEGV